MASPKYGRRRYDGRRLIVVLPPPANAAKLGEPARVEPSELGGVGAPGVMESAAVLSVELERRPPPAPAGSRVRRPSRLVMAAAAGTAQAPCSGGGPTDTGQPQHVPAIELLPFCGSRVTSTSPGAP